MHPPKDEPDEHRDADAADATLTAALRALPTIEPDGRVGERIRLRARAAFLRAVPTTRGDRWLAWLGRWYGRCEPALAAALVLFGLRWAVATAGAFLH